MGLLPSKSVYNSFHNLYSVVFNSKIATGLLQYEVSGSKTLAHEVANFVKCMVHLSNLHSC